MKRNIYMQVLFTILVISCSSNKKIIINDADKEYSFKVDTLNWFDSLRNRVIPVALYKQKTEKNITNREVIIFSHGYGENKGGNYLAYSYLTEKLASKGYFVVSIQHELTTDSLIPLTGLPQVVRRPFWERGAENILFVINELKRSRPKLNFKRLTLIAHSNGADMSALFAQQYPNLVNKIITLDNRRVALPRTKHPEVFSLRSSDRPADVGVIPSSEEQQLFGIKIIRLPHTIHNDMDDRASKAQRKEINDYILSFLKD